MESVSSHVIQLNLDQQVERFWLLEEVPKKKIYSAEEKVCMQHYAENHYRNEDGRYVVTLPLKEDIPLGNSRSRAMTRFLMLERKLAGNANLKEQYCKFIQEYLDLGHMTLLTEEDKKLPDSQVYFLPHHAVFKDSSTSTKLRVVFDASAKTKSGHSLNDKQLVGPVVQNDLYIILLRFRRWQIALVSDIVKMYRQVLHKPSDCNYLRILWRMETNMPILEYKCLTVTYGTACAPFLATQTLCQLASDEGPEFPLAANVLQNDTYVDDVATGENSVQSALQLYHQLHALTQRGKFQLSKWVSNSEKVMESIPFEHRGNQLPIDIESDVCTKTLGLQWHPSSDSYAFKVEPFTFVEVLTKRVVLSDTAKLFDPLGLLSPVTILPKLFMQILWKENLGWDEAIPTSVLSDWVTYRKELSLIESLRLSRCVIVSNSVKLELHGFSDASERAYAAAVYVKSVNLDGHIQVKLLTSKSRVAPLKSVSLPRLELCGAVLLANLIKTVHSELDLTFDSIYCWSDSSIVIAWINSQSHQWKPFVANRISEIHEVLPKAVWSHVPGKLNPADFPSRGILPSQLTGDHVWWTGPEYLYLPELPIWQEETPATSEQVLDEKKKNVIQCHVVLSDLSIIDRYSSLNQLKRVTAWCLRIFNNFKTKIKGGTKLTVIELQFALLRLIKLVQAAAFREEISALTKMEAIPKQSTLKQLDAFLDENSCLRVGGRLKYASHLPFDCKHPLIFPGNHHLTILIVRHLHITQLHAGPQLLLNALLQNYWVVNGRKIINYIIRKCKICCILRAKNAEQLMGNLPKARVTPSSVFSSCGIDYAGPYLLRPIKGRSPKLFKCYIALFICFATRAIHIELVSDLTTDSFLAALRRFISRHLKPREIYSDCGSNFIGADREMKEFFKLVQSEDHSDIVGKFLANEGIQWRFNPPSAPHMGGLWEAGVKSTKYHLKRVLGNTPLNFEEFATLLTQVEACLNSRPLCPISSSPEDLIALTPGQFTAGGVLTALPEPDYSHVKINRLSRWQLVQRISRQFWKRWSSEYLTRLQARPKWWVHQPNFQIGDLVLVKDERLPPQQWPLSRIISVHPGQDGKVRVVSVKSASGVIKRPISKICALPFADEKED